MLGEVPLTGCAPIRVGADGCPLIRMGPECWPPVADIRGPRPPNPAAWPRFKPPIKLAVPVVLPAMLLLWLLKAVLFIAILGLVVGLFIMLLAAPKEAKFPEWY